MHARFFFITLAVTVQSQPAFAVTTSQGDLQAIMGTYQCITRQHGRPTWRFRSVNSAWGSWMRADTTFTPQNGQPSDRAVTFVGYDSKAKRWSIVSLDVDGSYYTRHSEAHHLNGSRWVDNFPQDGGSAIITIPRTGRYTFDFKERVVSRDISHTTCTKTE